MRLLQFAFCCLFATSFFAQKKDSITIKTSLENPFFAALNKSFKTNEYLLFKTPIKNYTQAVLGIIDEQNKVRNSQTPSATRSYFLNTNGIYGSNKTWLIGNLSVVKNYEKNIGFNLSNLLYSKDEVEKSPFYNLAYEAGNWNNQFYKIEGTIAHQFNTKFFAVADLKYNVSQYFRTNNPIPKLTYLDVLATIKLGYNINKKNTIGVALHKGVLDNEIEIQYNGKESDLNLPINDSIYSRVSVGLGFLESAKTSNSKEKETTSGAGVFYSFKNDKNLINLTLDYFLKEHSYYQVFNYNNLLFGTYNTDIVSSNLQWFSMDNKRAITFKNEYKTGSNFRVATNGKNYEATAITSSLQYISAKDAYTYALGIDYFFLEKKDFQVQNSFSFKNTELNASYFKSFKLKESEFYAKLTTHYSFNLDSKEKYATRNKFIKEVTEKKVEILTASHVSLNAKIGFIKPIKTTTILNYGATFGLQNYFNVSIVNKTNTATQLFFKIIY